jgi:hypothetical protein
MWEGVPNTHLMQPTRSFPSLPVSSSSTCPWPSQVSGGFWEQLPRAMHQHYGTVTKHTISLHCVDARCSVWRHIRVVSPCSWPHVRPWGKEEAVAS